MDSGPPKLSSTLVLIGPSMICADNSRLLSRLVRFNFVKNDLCQSFGPLSIKLLHYKRLVSLVNRRRFQAIMSYNTNYP